MPQMTDKKYKERLYDMGQRLKVNREAYGITQADLAQHSGLSSRTICMMETGRKWWSVLSEMKYLDSLKALAEANWHRRKSSKHYTLPPILDPTTAIFQKYL